MKMDQVAITATDNQSKRVLSRFAALFGTKGILAALALTAGFIVYSPVHAAYYGVGIITKGTFLVSEDANIQQKDSSDPFTHGAIGYLPAGTLIAIKNGPIILDNLTKGKQEKYYSVSSSLGFSGLVHEDFLIRIQAKGKTLAIVTGSAPVTLHVVGPDKDPAPRKKDEFKLSRHDIAYMEITHTKDNYYLAELKYWTKNPSKSQPVRLLKGYVDAGLVTLIRDNLKLVVPKWSEQEKLPRNSIEQFIEKMKNKIIDILDSARTILDDAYLINQCPGTTIDKIKNSLRVFGIGAESHKGDEEQMFRLSQRKLIIGEKKTFYLMLQNIKCQDGRLEQLQLFKLQQGINDTQKQVSIHLQDLKELLKSKEKLLQGSKVSFRMVRINNEQGYMQLFNLLKELVAESDSFISKLPQQKQDILLNLILREISHFEFPAPNKLVSSQTGKTTK